MNQINGIRLSREMAEVRQQYADQTVSECRPLYEWFAENRINMICLGMHDYSTGLFNCCIEKDVHQKLRQTWKQESKIPAGEAAPVNDACPGLEFGTDVCLVSIYPHHSNCHILGRLFGLLGTFPFLFRHMVSSNAMVSFVIESRHQDKVVHLLEKGFDLPESHTPFRQEIDEDLSQFLKKYPETRAAYVEEKIKTYGINVFPNLNLYRYQPEHAELELLGRQFQSLAADGIKFHFTSAVAGWGSPSRYDLVVVTDPCDIFDVDRPIQTMMHTDIPGGQSPSFCDLISFHGPHFGDRYRIFNTAMACLSDQSVSVLLAGCTGASITLVLPQGMGEKGKQAVEKGFEVP